MKRLTGKFLGGGAPLNLKTIDRSVSPRYNLVMPNQRAKNIDRVTVTLDKDLLKTLEEFCAKNGMNRLEFIRKAVNEKLSSAEEKNENLPVPCLSGVADNEKSIDGVPSTWCCSSMPNQRSRDKRRVNLWLNRELYARVKRYCADRDITVTEFIVKFLAAETANVELTRDDYKKIYDSMRDEESEEK